MSEAHYNEDDPSDVNKESDAYLINNIIRARNMLS